MIKRVFSFWLTCLLISSPSLANILPPDVGNISIGSYEAAQKNSADKQTSEIYLKGVEDGFAIANGKEFLDHQKLLFCPPTNYGITGVQEKSILDKYLADTNNNPDLPIAAAFLKSLEEAFPCN